MRMPKEFLNIDFKNLLSFSIIIPIILIGKLKYDLALSRSKESELKKNMHTTQLCVEDFCTMAEGSYPGGICTTVRDLLGYDNDYCIAGDEIAPFPPNALLPRLTFLNPFNPSEISIKNSPYATYPSGCVYYSAYDINGALIGECEPGIHYKIYGMDRYKPINFYLHSSSEKK